MKQTTRNHMGLVLLAAFPLLACGGTHADSPPPAVTAPTPAPAPTPPPAATPPPVQTAPTEVTTALSLSPGFLPDPHTATGTAGGPLLASTLDPSCRGNVPNTPQHSLTLDDDFQYLKIMVNSTGDTTLAIRGPQGQYRCSDDGVNEGLNPAIEGTFAAGTYQVWVGLFAGTPAPYTIGLTEIGTTRSSSLPLR